MDVEALRRIVAGMLSSLSVPSLRWAKVTQVSPLRIQYIGEDPLPFTPARVGLAPTAVGEDVLTVQWGTRTTVLGSTSSSVPVVSRPGAKIYKTSNQSYSSDTWTKIVFDETEFSDATNFADVANNRLVIPESGRYMVGAGMSHPSQYGSSHLRQIILQRGDVIPSSLASAQLARSGAGNNADSSRSEWYASVSAPAEFTAGEYVTLWFRSSASSSTGTPSGRVCNLWAQKVK